MSKIFKILIILLFSENIYAQEGFIFFENVSYAQNFISEIRSPNTKIEIGYINNIDKNYYNNDELNLPFIETHLGYDLNIFSFSNNKSKFAFSLPAGTTTLTDMFEEKTAPVINTDYWFGTQIKFITYPFRQNKYLKNISANLQPLFHESTHLGDEFSLHGFEEVPNFKRINISYEAWDLSVTLNDPDTLKENMLSFKAGIQNLWTIKDGYYFTDSLEVKGANIPKSTKISEFYFVVNYQRTKGFLASKKWLNVFSAEARNRVQFSYDENIAEARAWGVNMYFGWVYKKSNKSFHNVGFFIRHYQGINPHGQFRNNNNFKFTGLSVSFL